MGMANAAKELIEKNVFLRGRLAVRSRNFPLHDRRRCGSCALRGILQGTERRRDAVRNAVLVLRERNHGSGSADGKSGLGL